MMFAAALPALRVAVNTGCSLGASGFDTNLGPAMTIGTGFAGGSSLSENLTPHHLVQFAKIAYGKSASERFGDFTGLDPLHLPRPGHAAPVKVEGQDADALRRELRKIILEELNLVLAA